jgi:glycerol-3-phosphate dehydrogenase
VLHAAREGDLWAVEVEDRETGARRMHRAKMLVNAGGPWVGKLLKGAIEVETREGVRLVRGSHIVTKRLYDHDRCYFFQGTDGRIIFAIPYESDFTLIGTTDADHPDPSQPAECTPEEQDYLCRFASRYFEREVTREDIVWTYSGVRPLYDDGASSATAATRDYTLTVDATGGAPVLNVFGGKITTYRRLAESAMEKIAPFLATERGDWTAGAPLPGGDFPVDGVEPLIAGLMEDYPFLDAAWARRLVRAYGTEARDILGAARSPEDLGRDFGATLREAEVAWLVEKEYARHADDVLWRRSKLGLRLSEDQAAALEDWMQGERAARHG